MNDTLATVQAEAWQWTKRNFPGQAPWHPLLGVTEELGELNHAYLKAVQGIRGTPEEHRAAMEDAVGDLVIFLANWCSHMGIDLSAAVARTWEQVRKRDWQAHPETGTSGDRTTPRPEVSTDNDRPFTGRRDDPGCIPEVR